MCLIAPETAILAPKMDYFPWSLHCWSEALFLPRKAVIPDCSGCLLTIYQAGLLITTGKGAPTLWRRRKETKWIKPTSTLRSQTTLEKTISAAWDARIRRKGYQRFIARGNPMIMSPYRPVKLFFSARPLVFSSKSSEIRRSFLCWRLEIIIF